MSWENYKSKFKIPKNYKSLITIDFQKQFLEEIHLINGYAVDMFACDTLFHEESTSGWNVAFLNACKKFNTTELIKYLKTLEWEDSEQFDDAFLDMLMENHLVLPGWESDEIEKQLNIPTKDFDNCISCGKFFKFEDMTKVKDDETGELCSFAECKNCSNEDNVSPIQIDIFKSLKEYLDVDKNDVFYCESCGHYHLNKFKTKNEICKYCELQKESEYESANSYYRKSLKETREWIKKIK